MRLRLRDGGGGMSMMTLQAAVQPACIIWCIVEEERLRGDTFIVSRRGRNSTENGMCSLV